MTQNPLTYRVNAKSLPEAEDLFSDLDEAYAEIARLQDEITTVFNDSTAREMLHGFVVVGKNDLAIKWTDEGAIVSITLKEERR